MKRVSIVAVLVCTLTLFSCQQNSNAPEESDKEEKIIFSEFNKLKEIVNGIHFTSHSVYPGECLDAKKLRNGEIEVMKVEAEPIRYIFNFTPISYISENITHNNLQTYTQAYATAIKSTEYQNFIKGGSTPLLFFQYGIADLEQDDELFETLKDLTGSDMIKRKKSFVAVKITESFSVTIPTLILRDFLPLSNIVYINSVKYGNISCIIIQGAKNLVAIEQEYKQFLTGKKDTTMSAFIESLRDKGSQLIFKGEITTNTDISNAEQLQLILERFRISDKSECTPIMYSTTPI